MPLRQIPIAVSTYFELAASKLEPMWRRDVYDVDEGKFQKKYVYFYRRKTTNEWFFFQEMYQYTARGISIFGSLTEWVPSEDIILTGQELFKYKLLKSNDDEDNPENFRSTLEDFFEDREGFFKELL